MSHIVPTRVRVKVPGPYQGQEGEIVMIYHDVYHRGDPDGGGTTDYYHVRLDSGKQIGGLDSHFEKINPGILVVEPGDFPEGMPAG